MARIFVVDYGLCNLDSVKRALEVCGAEVDISDNPHDLKTASKIILPGVSSYADSMHRLHQMGWVEPLTEEVLQNKIPLLGICLGMQLLSSHGHEGVEDGAAPTPGLNFIPGEVSLLKKKNSQERIPHIGWNEVLYEKPVDLLADIPSGKDFYFANSYHFTPANNSFVMAHTPYCGGFASIVNHENIWGAQFHPEKSQKVGQQFLRNFIHWNLPHA